MQNSDMPNSGMPNPGMPKNFVLFKLLALTSARLFWNGGGRCREGVGRRLGCLNLSGRRGWVGRKRAGELGEEWKGPTPLPPYLGRRGGSELPTALRPPAARVQAERSCLIGFI